jgi:squalene-hopene/tetraprenyl-beta-curcumene cyclase
MSRTIRWTGLALAAMGIAGLTACSPKADAPKDASKGAVSRKDGHAPGGACCAPKAAYDKAAVQAAHKKALDYLAAQQKADGEHAGGWLVEVPGKGSFPDLGVAGLCTYALAKAPDPAAYKAHLERAAAYILKQSQPDGSFCDAGGVLKNYKTSIAVLALTAIDPVKHKDRVIQARDYILSTQSKDGVWKGGFGYGDTNTRGEKREKADLSNTDFAIQALAASGLPKDHPAYKDAVAFVEACQNRSENATVVGMLAAFNMAPLEDGGVKYTPIAQSEKELVVELPGGKKGAPSSGSMTYTGLLTFIYAGVHKDDPKVQAAYDWIRSHYTLEENPGLRREKPGSGQQGLYYYFHTFAKALDAYGEATLKTADGAMKKWAEDLAAELARLQKPDGSWINENDRWMEGDPRLVTAFGAMSLNVLAKWLQ